MKKYLFIMFPILTISLAVFLGVRSQNRSSIINQEDSGSHGHARADMRSSQRQQRNIEIAKAGGRFSQNFSDRLSEGDFMSLAEEALTESDISRKKFLLTTVLEGWLADDPGGALLWAGKIDDESLRDFAVYTVITKAAKLDAENAMKLAETLSTGPLKESVVKEVLDSWAQADHLNALKWVEANASGVQKSAFLVQIANQLVSDQRFEIATTLLDKIPLGSYRFQLIKEIVASWIEKDSESALNWAINLSDPLDQQHALELLPLNWAKNDPAAAIAFGSDLSGPARSDFLSKVVSVWGRHDPDAMLKWLSDSNVEKSPSVISAAYTSWSATKPKDALLAVMKLEDDKMKGDIITNVTSNWARSNPEEAAVTLKSLPEGQAKSAAIGRLVSHWVRLDYSQAAEWANTLEQGDSRDQAALSVGFAIAEVDPHSALDWVGSINNAQLRSKWITKLGKEWLSDAPKEATSHLYEMNLSKEELKRIGLGN